MGGDDFFDSFATKVALSDDDVAALNALLAQLATDGADVETARAAYRARVGELLAAQGADLERALADAPGFVYLTAAADAAVFDGLFVQTSAAAAAAAKSAAEAEAAGGDAKGTWVPPPPDAEPEDLAAE